MEIKLIEAALDHDWEMQHAFLLAAMSRAFRNSCLALVITLSLFMSACWVLGILPFLDFRSIAIQYTGILFGVVMNIGMAFADFYDDTNKKKREHSVATRV